MSRDEIIVRKEDLCIDFYKAFFTVEDIELASCYGFNIHKSVIQASLNRTSKLALFEFMKTAYPSLIFHPYYESQRNTIFAELSEVYNRIEKSFYEFAKERWDKFDDLFDYQKETVMWGLLRKQNMFGLDQGLGKSASAIAVNEVLGYRRCLIVAPAACKWNWLEELLTWDIDIQDISVVDTKDWFNGVNGKYIIMNYDILDRYLYAIEALGVDHIVLDEAHKIKNIESKRSEIISKFIKKVKPKVTYLSGTPTPNNIKDIFIYLHLSEHPFGVSNTKFMNRFFAKPFTKDNPTSKLKPINIEYLNKSIQNLLIRKTKDQCLNLPPKNYHKMFYDLGDFKEAYDSIYKELQDMLRKSNKNTDIEGIIQRLNIVTAKAKLPHIIKLAEGLIGEKHKVLKKEAIKEDGFSLGQDDYIEVFGKVIIYSVNREPIHMVKQHFGDRCLVIDGTVPTRKRLEIVNKFKSDNNINVLACNLDAAGIGLNIVNRENQKDRPPIFRVIHINLPFTPAQLEQGNDRVHRIGQYHPVDIYYTVAKKTIDEDLIEMIMNKHNNISRLIEGKQQDIDFNQLDNSILEDLKANILNFSDNKSRTELLKEITDEQEGQPQEERVSPETTGGNEWRNLFVAVATTTGSTVTVRQGEQNRESA